MLYFSMNLEKVVHVLQEEAEKGLRFLRNGLPEESVPIGGKQFLGYYSLVRQIGENKVRLTYEPTGKASYSFRNACVLQ